MGSLRFSDRAARTAWRAVPKRALSGAIGWGASRGVPQRLRTAFLTRFARAYGIDAAEAERSLAEYANVDAFFTRRLRAGARTVDLQPDAVVSPADGTVIEAGLAIEGQLIQAKGVLFDLEELLADEEAATRLDGGAYLITYLSPRDYHRVHSPVTGGVIGWHHVPGTLFPVGAKSVGREPGLFVSNERLVTLIDGTAGLCAVVMVAAIGVGHITAAYDDDIATHSASFVRAGVRHKRYDAPRQVQKGDELGTFHLGSTTIVVFEPERVTLQSFTPGGVTRMGEMIGRLNPLGVQAVREIV
jgi:phosphatidylserine decarboxylase